MSKKIISLLAGLFFAVSLHLQAQENIPSPESFFGFNPGTDRELFNYQSLISYLKKVDEASSRAKMIEIGESPMGKKMYLFFLSSEENIKNLDRLKEINQKLALDTKLSETEIKSLTDEGKVFILATLSMHSTEVGPSQSAPLIAYEVATSSDKELLTWLDDVVYMIVPCHNPDGMDMVVDFYKSAKGTKYEGGNMPNVYHKYVGHDNNRDFVTLTQKDTKVISEIYTKTWMPQVMVEKHQMGPDGPRYFVPPMHDPIAENIDEKIWNWTWIFGSNMAKDMAAKGQAGVSQHYLFDDYWPGSTETALWKNVIGLLTECASAQIAKPIYIEKSELIATGKGLGEYKKSINMPLPWEGGWWRLSDIVNYEMASTWSLIKTGSKYRSDILKLRNEMACSETSKGLTESPAYFILPKTQHDESSLVELLSLLDEHHISVYQTGTKLDNKGQIIYQGDYVVPLSQPFRAFIKEILEPQKFPARHYTPGGELIKPYDIASWSLPLHKGVKSFEIEKVSDLLDKTLVKVAFPLKMEASHGDNAKAIAFPAKRNESYKLVFKAMAEGFRVLHLDTQTLVNGNQLEPGDFIIQPKEKEASRFHEMLAGLTTSPIMLSEVPASGVKELKMPSIALIETNFHDMDAGWTRFVLDSYAIPFKILKPADVKTNDLGAYDVIVFPNNNSDVLLEGKSKTKEGEYRLPPSDPKYIKGMEAEGLQNLMKFVNEGGTVLSWGESTGLFMKPLSLKISEKEKEEFKLPVSDISDALSKQGLNCPGSLLKVNLVKNHPLTFGMPDNIGVFSRGKPVFTTSVPYFDIDRRVLGTYPEDEKILLSGYAENEELLQGKSAIVWIKKGKGQLVLYGFNPQFRASTSGTFKLLFNGLLLK
ncbi:MAG TPA: hypothetical protein DCR40_15240 [Prolixibacteraceae bacterium]|nr:hypothetical protein [Prolixibacteraceae bacterium]